MAQDLSNPAEVITTPHAKAQAKAKKAGKPELPASARYTCRQTVMVGAEQHDVGDVVTLTKAQATPIFPDAIELTD